MKKTYAGLLAVSFALVTTVVLADRDEERGGSFSASSASVSMNSTYQKECSGCHMAYPADLLPAASWDKVMNNLADHFGDNAEVDKASEKEIRDYLAKNAGDVTRTRLASKVLRGLGNEVPMRISELPYIAREHRKELPKDVFKKSDKLTSLAQCDGCHTKAKEGSFREREIVIPGVGRWED